METVSSTINFGPSTHCEPFLGVMNKVVRCFDSDNPVNLSASGLKKAAKMIQNMGIAEAGQQMESFQGKVNLIYQAAKIFSKANSDAALQGLESVLADMLSLPVAGNVAVEICGIDQVMVLITSGDSNPVTLFARDKKLNRTQICNLPFNRLESLLGHSVSATGFAFGQWLTVPANEFSNRLNIIEFEQCQQFKTLKMALYCGLLVGIAEKLSSSAYQYANERQSSNKAIAQHQGVALRLADITLHLDGLTLYLDSLFDQEFIEMGVLSPDIPYIDELTYKLSRDAVQTAAGHGFVEGLPFRRLFEQIKTMIGLLQFWCSTDFIHQEVS